MLLGTLLTIAVLLYSVILHEIAHGAAALYFGDSTAKDEGRLTLNPIPHLDLFGSILLPAFCILSGAPIFGWAKPVPVNFNFLSRKEEICVSLAGVLVNFGIAMVFGLILRFFGSDLNLNLMILLSLMVRINLLLAVFNLMPIPPLDGWRIWGVWLPDDMRYFFETNAFMFLIILLVLLPYLPIFPLVQLFYSLITGM
ncbi:MAG: site-2 protease family protein [bacterium]|nr:site-2 protease family protein [bacterium]